jgi:hypothetical protein
MIDIFVPANDDGIGDIQTLTIGRVSNDNRANGMCRRFGCLSEGRALAMPGRRDRAGLILRIDSWSMQLSFYFDDDCPVLRFALVGPPFLNLNFALVHQLRLLSWLSRGRAQPTRQSEIGRCAVERNVIVSGYRQARRAQWRGRQSRPLTRRGTGRCRRPPFPRPGWSRCV